MDIDTFFEIIYNSDIKTIEALCKTNKQANSLCRKYKNHIIKTILKKNDYRIFPEHINLKIAFKDIYDINNSDLSPSKKKFNILIRNGNLEAAQLMMYNMAE